MANIQITDLDFQGIKENLKLYLKGQDVLKDADYEGSVLSTLLDILALNTHYNGYYLNMAVNEMFLDTAVKRNSIVSMAKSLGFTPASTHSCQAILDITFNGVKDQEITIPKYTKFVSKTFDIFYTFVTNETYSITASGGKAIFKNVTIIEGEPVLGGNGIRNIYRSAANPTASFIIPDTNVDLNTLEVVVQNSTVDRTLRLFLPKENFAFLDGNSEVYFVEETSEGFYQVYFGDNVLGTALDDGNVVFMRYLISSGSAVEGATDFKVISSIPGKFDSIVVSTVSPATGGQDKQSMDSIKFAAPKYYSAQNRAVSYQDYISALNNNAYNFAFDSVNVWGGQENEPPVYGKVFVALKPKGSYTLTLPQKDVIKAKIIKPISVVTVEPEIIDPDYIFIKVMVEVVYDSNKTFYDGNKLSKMVRDAILTFSDATLNKFNSVFSYPDLMYTIQNVDPSIITNECNVMLQKKFLPNYQFSGNYEINFGTELERGLYYAGLTSSPGLIFKDKTTPGNTVSGIILEEVPVKSGVIGGVQKIFITNKGYNYDTVPEVIITGDGEGASAIATLVNKSLKSITIDKPGKNYTYANIEIVSKTGKLGTAVASVIGKYGTLQWIYYNAKKEKVVYSSAGFVDYETGKVTLTNFNPSGIDETDNPLKQLILTAKPKSNIIYSTRNRLITIDPDTASSSVVIKVKNKNQ